MHFVVDCVGSECRLVVQKLEHLQNFNECKMVLWQWKYTTDVFD